MAASASSSGFIVSSAVRSEPIPATPTPCTPRGPDFARTSPSDVFIQVDSGSVVVVPRRLVPLSKLLMDVVVDYDTTESDPFPCLDEFTYSAFKNALRLLGHVREAWEWVYRVRVAEKMSDLPAWGAVQAHWEDYQAEADESAREVLSWLLAWPMPDLSTGSTIEGAWYCSHGDPDLFRAAEEGWPGVVHLLRSCGEIPASRLNAMDENDKTPLIKASEHGHRDVCEALIAAGAHMNMMHRRGKTALHYAAEHGHKAICDTLIAAGAKVDARHGMTALQYAAEHGHKAICDTLIAAGADVNMRHRIIRMTALHFAAEHGHKAICDTLIAAGADVNMKHFFWMTALHCGAKNGHMDVCDSLIGAGANVNIKDRRGKTALHYAAEHGHKAICDTLIAAGAKVDARHFVLLITRRQIWSGISWFLVMAVLCACLAYACAAWA